MEQVTDRRRNPDYVTKLEFGSFKDRIDTALFAPDDKNDFGQPGLTVMMRDIYHTRNAWCRIVRLAKQFVLFVFGVGAPLAAIGKTLGWW